MLVGNGVRLNSNPMRQLSAPLANVVHRASWMQAGAGRNQWTHTGRDRRSGVPDGLLAPSSWRLPITGGGMSARNVVFVTTTLGSLLMASGRNVDGSTTLTFSVPNADLQLVVSASGTTAITFSGSSTLAGALDAIGTTAITFTVPTPTLGALIDALATVAVTWSGTGTARATGALAGDITPFTELSPQTLAAAVWAEVLESGLDAQDVMRVLLAVAAGKTDIVGTTVTFRDQADTKDRVTATMTGSERTTVAIDAA
jgi:hypothetical protein